MKAATQTRYGSPDVLTVTEEPTPVPRRDQILVRVHASAVTQGDRRLRAADFPGVAAVLGRLMFGVTRPRNRTTGTMFAGRVVAVGAAVTRFAVGDDVFGSCDRGAHAELLVVDQGGPVAKTPAGVPYHVAAAVPYGAGTALAFLRDVAAVRPGERVAIVGAAGGVGRFAVQIARHLGAHVTGVCRGEDADLVRRLGAHEVVDYTREDYTRRGRTYDVVFDTASGSGFRAARRSLAPAGRYVTLYLSMLMLAQMLWTRLRGGPEATGAVIIGNQALTESVAALLEQGAIQPVIAARYPLDRIADAHAKVDGGRTRGAVVVTIGHAERDQAPVTLAVA